MTESPARIEILHVCAVCGAPAALPADGGMQLSVIDARRRVAGWAVHPDCLRGVLAPGIRDVFERAFRG